MFLHRRELNFDFFGSVGDSIVHGQLSSTFRNSAAFVRKRGQSNKRESTRIVATHTKIAANKLQEPATRPSH